MDLKKYQESIDFRGKYPESMKIPFAALSIVSKTTILLDRLVKIMDSKEIDIKILEDLGNLENSLAMWAKVNNIELSDICKINPIEDFLKNYFKNREKTNKEIFTTLKIINKEGSGFSVDLHLIGLLLSNLYVASGRISSYVETSMLENFDSVVLGIFPKDILTEVNIYINLIHSVVEEISNQIDDFEGVLKLNLKK